MSSDEVARISASEWRALPSEQTENGSDTDAELVALGLRFEALSAELAVLQGQESEKPSALTQRSDRKGNAVITPSVQRIETLLKRLEPIERAIMAIPAMTVAGLGVKARHAAHVLSHYWTDSPERLDWDARAVRRLIESTCILAGVALVSSQQQPTKQQRTAGPL